MRFKSMFSLMIMLIFSALMFPLNASGHIVLTNDYLTVNTEVSALDGLNPDCLVLKMDGKSSEASDIQDMTSFSAPTVTMTILVSGRDTETDQDIYSVNDNYFTATSFSNLLEANNIGTFSNMVQTFCNDGKYERVFRVSRAENLNGLEDLSITNTKYRSKAAYRSMSRTVMEVGYMPAAYC